VARFPIETETEFFRGMRIPDLRFEKRRAAYLHAHEVGNDVASSTPQTMIPGRLHPPNFIITNKSSRFPAFCVINTLGFETFLLFQYNFLLFTQTKTYVKEPFGEARAPGV
jgi:hypothetical protein